MARNKFCSRFVSHEMPSQAMFKTVKKVIAHRQMNTTNEANQKKIFLLSYTLFQRTIMKESLRKNFLSNCDWASILITINAKVRNKRRHCSDKLGGACLNTDAQTTVIELNLVRVRTTFMAINLEQKKS